MFKNPWVNKQLVSVTQRLSEWLKRPIVWAPPRHIAVEVTNFCNLRCPMCKLGTRVLGRDMGLMDFDKFCGLIDEITPYVRRLSIPWYGEPFTRKDLGRFVRYASDKGMAIHLQTNGTRLHECEIDFLAECNVRAIAVAVDGLEQETYETYRVGGTLANIVAGVKRIVALRAERGTGHPKRIDMNFLVMSHNEHELPHVPAFAKEAGFDRVKIKTVRVEHSAEGKKLLPADPDYCVYEESFDLKFGRRTEPGCSDLWDSAVVSWDGAMGACCIDSDCEFSPGNVFEDGFFALWFGDKMQAFRRQVLHDKLDIPLCRECDRASSVKEKVPT